MMFLVAVSISMMNPSDVGSSEAIRRRAADSVKREQIQKELEFGDLKSIEEKDFRQPRYSSSPDIPVSSGILDGIGAVAKVIIYVVIAVFVVLLALFVYRLIEQRQLAAAKASILSQSIQQAGSDGENPDLASADELAAQGRWEEAVHALLLSAIAYLTAQFGQQKASRTSRELLNLFKLDERRRGALRTLILAVEQIIFGRAVSDAAMFARCRESWHVVMEPIP